MPSGTNEREGEPCPSCGGRGCPVCKGTGVASERVGRWGPDDDGAGGEQPDRQTEQATDPPPGGPQRGPESRTDPAETSPADRPGWTGRHPLLLAGALAGLGALAAATVASTPGFLITGVVLGAVVGLVVSRRAR